MTLLIAIGSSNYVVMLADRKIIDPSGYRVDSTTKLFSMETRDARIIGAWTGLASDGKGFELRPWLLGTLAKSAAPEHSLGPMLSRFRDAATETFAAMTLSPRLKKLAIILGGLVFEDPPRPYVFRVTNYDADEPDAEPKDEFHVEYWREARPVTKPPALVIPAGYASEITREDIEPIARLAQSDPNPRAAVERGAHLIRTAARSDKGKRYISEDCQSLTLYSDPSREGEADIHSLAPVTMIPLPDHLEARGGEFGVVEYWGGEVGLQTKAGQPVLVKGPKPRRNDRCPCGSGLKYKRCHGRPGEVPEQKVVWGVRPIPPGTEHGL